MAAKKKSPNRKPKGNGHAPKKMARVDTKTDAFTKPLRCELTDEEVIERSKSIARKLSDRSQRVEMAKASTAHLKAEIKQIDAEIAKLSQEVNDSACFRDVSCERRHIYRTGKIEEVRLDTDEVIYERAMTGAERQLELPKTKSAKGQAATEEAAEVLQEHLERADAELASDVADDETGDAEPPSDDETVVEDTYQPETGDQPAE